MKPQREKFTTQVDSALLSDLRALANQEGRQIQALVEEALNTLIDDRKTANARSHVMGAYQKSHAGYSGLYTKLAK